MEEAKKKSVIPYIAMALLFALVVVYTVYHISSIFGEGITTIAAGVSTDTTSVSGSGYVFRDEKLLYSDNIGVVDYIVNDGEKVRKDQSVADVYEGGSHLGGRDTVRLLDSRIALLEKSIAKSGTDMTSLRKSLNDTYYSIVKQLSDGDVRGLSRDRDALLTEMNMIQSLLGGESSSVNQALSSLASERAALFDSAGGYERESVLESGYFYHEADGYESAFSAEFALGASGEALYSLITEGLSTAEVSPACYGKIAADADWIFVMPIDVNEREYFEVGNTYSMNVVSGTMGVLPMTLEKILEVSSDERSLLLVFSCDRLPESGALDRSLSVSVTVDSRSGIYVPAGAIELLDGYRGVYVLKGSVVCFRTVEIIYIGNDYFLVAEEPEDENIPYEYLTVNELIIVNGKNLFDGRILD